MIKSINGNRIYRAQRIFCCLIFLLLPFSISVSAQELFPKSIIPEDTTRLRLIFAGDMMGHVPLVKSCLTDDGKYDYTPIFENIKAYVSSADIAVANLELTLAGPPYAGYPQFSSPDAVVEGLKKTGFNVLVTANNHALDRGRQGVDRTIDVLDSLQIYHTGTFRDSADMKLRNPLIIEKNNIKLAILNYTYGTNGFKPQVPDLVNYIDTAGIRRDIENCRSRDVDFIVVVLHWGVEYERYPNNKQRELAEYIRSLGADAIIGSHPHVVQPVERFGNLHDPESFCPVVFSLGNFVSNQRDRYKDGGIIFELDLVKYHHTRIQSVSYLPVWVYKGVIDGRMAYRLIPPQGLAEAVARYNMDDQDKQRAIQFFNDIREHLNNIPVYNPYIMSKTH